MNACPESIGELSIIITEDTVTEACLIMLHRHSLSRRYRYIYIMKERAMVTIANLPIVIVTI